MVKYFLSPQKSQHISINVFWILHCVQISLFNPFATCIVRITQYYCRTWNVYALQIHILYTLFRVSWIANIMTAKKTALVTFKNSRAPGAIILNEYHSVFLFFFFFLHHKILVTGFCAWTFGKYVCRNGIAIIPMHNYTRTAYANARTFQFRWHVAFVLWMFFNSQSSFSLSLCARWKVLIEKIRRHMYIQYFGWIRFCRR